MNVRTCAVAFAATTIGLACFPRCACAGDDATEAERLFQEAKGLMEQGRFAEACPKLERSRALDPQVGTTLNLAFCYESLGKTASGWSMWLDGAAAAGSRGQADRETLARHRAELLESRLLRVTILVDPTDELAGVDVRLDGVPIPKTRWGAPTPVDPGPHWVQATSPGKRPWAITIQVDDQHVPLVRVPGLEPTAGAEAPANENGPQQHSSVRRVVALTVGGVGLAALGGAGAILGVAKSTYDNATCIGNVCTTAGQTDRNRAKTEANVATVSASVGAAALAGALVLWLAPASPDAAIRLQPSVGSNWGFSLAGGW